MRWGLLFSFLLFFFILDGTILQVFSLNAWHGSFYILPRFTLVLLIFVSLFIGRREAFALGLIVGLFVDIQYSGVIGVYAFAMAFIPYLSALAYQYFQINLFLIIFTIFASVYVQETVTFLLFDLFGLARDGYDLLTHLPTAAFNALFALIAYKPITKLMISVRDGKPNAERF